MFIVPVSRETRQLSRLLDDSFDRFFGSSVGAVAPTTRSPALDVSESDNAYVAKLEVPGVAKEDLKVSVDGRRVTVKAQSQPVEEKKEADPGSSDRIADRIADRIVYRERAVSSYARTFTLPVEVNQAEADAKLEHGVLTLTLPKRNTPTAAQLTVN